MTIAADVRDMVKDALADTELSKSVKIRRSTAGSWVSTSTPSKGKTMTVVDYTINVVFVECSEDDIDETAITKSKKVAHLALASTTDKDGTAVSNFVPIVGDYLVDSSDVWKITIVEHLYELGGVIVHAVVRIEK